MATGTVRDGRRGRRKEEGVRKMMKGRGRESVRHKRKNKKRSFFTHGIGRIRNKLRSHQRENVLQEWTKDSKS